MNRQTAFKITIHIKYCIKVRKPVFNIMYGKFWFDSDFFVQNLDVSVNLPTTSGFHKGIFFSFLDRMVLFLSFLGLFIF